MARQLVEKYIFTPGTAGAGTIKLPGKVNLSQLLIIANKTQQVNMYTLGDPTKNATVSYNAADTTFKPLQVNGPTQTSTQLGATTVTFASDTSLYNSTDQIAVYTDAPSNVGNIIRPYAFGVDAIERMRVSEPQSLIDADFEYGLQPTKWLSYSDILTIPGIYEKPGLDLFVTNVTTDGNSPSLITVTTSVAHNLSLGNPVIIYGLGNTPYYARAEGSFVINSTPLTTTFTFYAKGIVGTSGLSLYTGSTYGRKAGFYNGAGIPISSITSNGANPSVITVTCSAAHGLTPGAPIVSVATSNGTNQNLVTGDYYAETVPSSTTFTFTAQTGGAVSSSGLTATIYTRSDAFVAHRPFDGGVQLGTNTAAYGATVLRQTKKYMRYQSGKGILWTSGVLFNPVANMDQISASGTTVGSTITVTTEYEHGLQAGATVVLSGVVTSGYNGTYGVTSIISEVAFTVSASSVLGSASAVLTDLPRVTLTGWSGAAVRVGPFDDQNGLFWEYDGSQLWVVRRSGTYQLSGFISVSTGSQSVSGVSSRFTQQLKAGDNIVIKGQTYKVNSITNDTTMTINPAFRGQSNATSIKIAKILEERYPQSQFNVDKLDGTGFSGYNIALNKMQMMGISFSWYGAGFIDFMCRGPDGNMVLAHRMPQNNKNDAAYMRSGNMVVRYQSINDVVADRLVQSMSSSDTTIYVNDVSRFPSAGGTVWIEGELINYTGTNLASNSLTGCTRGASYSFFAGGTNRSFTGQTAASHAVGNGYNAVRLVSVTASPVITHWGSSYIMDGKFDSDRGYYFNYASVNNTVTASQSYTAFFLRLAPSVSDSISGNGGVRDLINKSQMLLQQLQIQSDQSVQVYGILNPGNVDASTLTWSSINTAALGSQPSFAQVSTSNATAATPGEQIFSTLGQPGGFAAIDLSALKELGNSPIGGYSNFPDGPDVLAVVINNLSSSTAHVNINLFWSEAQA